MEIEKLPQIIEAIQSKITKLNKRVDALSNLQPNDGKHIGKVRLRLLTGEIVLPKDLGDNTFGMGEIDGIIIPTLDGREFILYPIYKKLPLLDDNSQVSKWKAKSISEIENLYSCSDDIKETTVLQSLDSPAAKFVREVSNHRLFNIAGDLLVAMAVIKHRDKINKIASYIDNANMIDCNACVWSCSRCSASSAWYAGGYYDFAGNYYFTSSQLAIPLALYTA